ncbi:helix-turn-helix domain-containing protein [Streptomyces sp. NPDC055092]
MRSLHKLFTKEGTTVGRWILRRRLENGRELARRGNASPTVPAVALRWGSVNAAHFSRFFHAAYNVSPANRCHRTDTDR